MIKLEDALDNCLEQIAAGEATADDCAARYPQHEKELQTLLQTAEQLQEQGEATSPPPAFKARGRARLLAHMRAQPRAKAHADPAQAPKTPGRLPVLSGLLHGLRRRPALALVAAFVLLMFVTSAAQAALPGDPLYGWKRASERVWRAVHPDPLAADLALSNRRAAELIRVVGEDEAEPVARASYREALTQLATYDEPRQRARIETTVAGQRAQFSAAGVRMPELEKLLPSPAPTEEPPGTQPATASPTSVLPEPATTEGDSGPLPTDDPPGTLEETPLPPVLETVSPDLEAPDAGVTPSVPQIGPTIETNLP